MFDLRRTLSKYLRAFFARNCGSGDWSNGPIRLQYMPLCGQTFHPYLQYKILSDLRQPTKIFSDLRQPTPIIDLRQLFTSFM